MGSSKNNSKVHKGQASGSGARPVDKSVPRKGGPAQQRRRTKAKAAQAIAEAAAILPPLAPLPEPNVRVQEVDVSTQIEEELDDRVHASTQVGQEMPGVGCGPDPVEGASYLPIFRTCEWYWRERVANGKDRVERYQKWFAPFRFHFHKLVRAMLGDWSQGFFSSLEDHSEFYHGLQADVRFEPRFYGGSICACQFCEKQRFINALQRAYLDIPPERLVTAPVMVRRVLSNVLDGAFANPSTRVDFHLSVAMSIYGLPRIDTIASETTARSVGETFLQVVPNRIAYGASIPTRTHPIYQSSILLWGACVGSPVIGWYLLRNFSTRPSILSALVSPHTLWLTINEICSRRFLHELCVRSVTDFGFLWSDPQ